MYFWWHCFLVHTHNALFSFSSNKWHQTHNIPTVHLKKMTIKCNSIQINIRIHFYLRYSSQLISWFLFLHWIINIHFTIFSFSFISFHWYIFYFLFYYCSIIRINNSFDYNAHFFVWLKIKKNSLFILWIAEILISFHFKKRIEFNFNDTVYRMKRMNLWNINQHSTVQWNQMNNTFGISFPKR